MAMVVARAGYALDMLTQEFLWPGLSRRLGPNQVTAIDGIISGVYKGDLSSPNGQPLGIVEDYKYVYNDSRTEWQIVGASVDAAQLFALLDDNKQAQAMALMLAGDDLLFGSYEDDVLLGYAGNDLFSGDPGKDRYDGGSGVDKIDYELESKFFTISATNNETMIIDRTAPEDADRATNVEIVQFGDTSIDLRFLVTARFALASQYQDLLDLYTSYFNRAPDAHGIAYWASRLVEGMTLEQIAKSFFVQPETLAAFPDTMTTTQFVTQVYNNALGRAPDAPGLAYWVNDLDTGNQTRDKFMLALIYGARAVTGSSADAEYIGNKGEVGKYFALGQGLGDVDWAIEAMAHVDGTAQSVADAKHLIDTFAERAETAAEARLLLPFVGLLHDLPA